MVAGSTQLEDLSSGGETSPALQKWHGGTLSLGAGFGPTASWPGPNFIELLSTQICFSMYCFALINKGLRTKFSRDFQDKQTTAEYM